MTKQEKVVKLAVVGCRHGEFKRNMQIICEQNEEGMLICEIPETEKIETLQEVETDTGSFYVDEAMSYGEILIAFFLFVLVFLKVVNLLFSFFLNRSVRLRRYEL